MSKVLGLGGRNREKNVVKEVSLSHPIVHQSKLVRLAGNPNRSSKRKNKIKKDSHGSEDTPGAGKNVFA